MTKFARVIVVFIVYIFVLSLFPKILNAEYLISPLADDYEQNGESINNYQLSIINSSVDKPSITFGQILGWTDNQTTDNKTEKLLARLGEMTGEAAKRLAMIDNIYALITTPVPTYHPKLEKILADETINSYQLSAISNQLIDKNNKTINVEGQNPTTDYRQPITNNIGVLEENPMTNTYTIALLGDSMVETMGKDLPHLRKLLQEAYPNRSFILLNYGQGATNLDSGLYRLTNSTTYLGQEYLPLINYKPHILVVESFAYNHGGGQFYDLDRQWLTIAKIIDTVKKHSPETKIILAATIAPNTRVFGDGKLNWPMELKWNSATITKAYLQNVINFATSEHYPLADAYHPSLDSSGNGQERYINQGDHLHPSDEGKLLFSQKIVETIKKNEMIK